jgi:murein DD-endopeptidase MepM/ murein hydrolase activator NlpD
MWRFRHLVTLLLLLIAVFAFSQEQVHTLRQGETIYTLARRYGVSPDVLLSYNDIEDPTRLPVGARIAIPGTYVVREGEYVYSIARKLGIDWQELLRVNDLTTNDVVRPGDVLLIPGGSAVAGRVNESGAATADRADESRDATTVAATTTEPGDTESTTVSVAEPPIGTTLLWPHPGTREQWDGKFRGVVMNGAPGDTFRSVTSGVVSFVGPFTSFGKLILVQGANGYLYGYAGADRVDVVQGQRVENGTVLGSVGVSPAFRSARVLFTVWRNNRYVDPESAPRG